jgi:DNA mismatch repair protein MutL
VYNYLKVAIRHALGSHNITPTLDFDQETSFNATPTNINQYRTERPRTDSVGSYRDSSGNGGNAPKVTGDAATRDNNNLRNWQRLYEGLELIESKGNDQPSDFSTEDPSQQQPELFETFTIGSSINAPQQQMSSLDDETGTFSKERKDPYQLHGHYIVNQIKSGFLLIDQQAASERILYERYIEALGNQPISTQTALFPRNVELPGADAALMREILPEINKLGFDIAEFGSNTFIVHGVPADLGSGKDEQMLIEKLLSRYKDNMELELGIQDNLARAMARSAALKRGQQLSGLEMQDLIDSLFACAVPYKSPSGRNCFITFEMEELQKRFTS